MLNKYSLSSFSSDLVCCIRPILTKHELLFQDKINLNLKPTPTYTFGGAYLMTSSRKDFIQINFLSNSNDLIKEGTFVRFIEGTGEEVVGSEY